MLAKEDVDLCSAGIVRIFKEVPKSSLGDRAHAVSKLFFNVVSLDNRDIEYLDINVDILNVSPWIREIFVLFFASCWVTQGYNQGSLQLRKALEKMTLIYAKKNLENLELI